MDPSSYFKEPKSLNDILGAGVSALILFIPPNQVAKCPHPHTKEEVHHEQIVFETLGPHPRILHYFGVRKQSQLILEYHPHGCLRRVLLKLGPQNPARAFEWAGQIAEGLAYLHSRGVIHCDLSASNILVTNGNSLVLCDFAGSSLNGKKPGTSCYETRCSYPKDPEEWDKYTVRDDLFALGSVLYELYTATRPYASQTDEEVEILYRQGKFPDVNTLPVGEVIMSCWQGTVQSAEDVLFKLNNPDPLPKQFS